jgi:hypothetical protein
VPLRPEAGADPGQDVRQVIAGPDGDRLLGGVWRLEQRGFQPHLTLGDTVPCPRPRVLRLALIDHLQRSVEVDKHEVGLVVAGHGGQLPPVVSSQEQVVIDQGLTCGQERADLPAGDVLDEVVLGRHRRAGRYQVPVGQVDLEIVRQQPDAKFVAQRPGQDGLAGERQAAHGDQCRPYDASPGHRI